jgi:hypothetical protein
MSYIEKTARKLHPILNELKKRMIPEKSESKTDSEVTESDKIDLKNILGYLNQGEWTNKLSIG